MSEQQKQPGFAKWLRKTRLEQGRTQKELAEYLHINPKTVTRWEQGSSIPRPYLRPQLAKLLGPLPDDVDATSNEPLRLSPTPNREPQRQQKAFSETEQAYYRIRFGEMMKQWRSQVRMNQDQLGRFVGGHTRLSDTLIKQWEAGVHIPEEIYLRKLIHAFIDLHRDQGLLNTENIQEAIKEFWFCAWCAGASINEDPDSVWIETVMSSPYPRDQLSTSSALNDLQQRIDAFIQPFRNSHVRSGLRHFLESYLGSAQDPIAFGGRDGVFESLNAWLNEPQQPPYCIIAAPAGMGKSALLARWWYQIEQREDLCVLFFSVGIRFNTNLAGIVFPELVQRLADVHRKHFSFSHNMTPEEWQGLLAQYLELPLPNGKRLVLILDGVDEAADWSIHPGLFPRQPHESTRVILSARTTGDLIDAQAWSRLLGENQPTRIFPLDLEKLNRIGVKDVIHDAILPEELQQKQALLVEKLYHLSEEGDPLIIQLYIRDLQMHEVQLEDLEQREVGLKGYFENWWDDQRKQWRGKVPFNEALVQAVLYVFACALGPIDRDGLAQVLPPELKINRKVALGITLESVLELLGRLVSGDGRQQGYAFTHPRLARFFYEKIDEEERLAIEARFLSWGQKTLKALNEGSMSPKDVHPYLLQYYGRHMERMHRKDPQPMFSLVSDGWRRAWEEYEGLYAGFLSDVSLAWKHAENLNQTALTQGKQAPHLEMEVLCALCQASVIGIVAHVPSSLLIEGIKRKILTIEQVLAYAHQLRDAEQQATILVDLLLVPSSKSRKRAILRELLDLLQEVKSGPGRVHLVEKMSPHLYGPLVQETRIILRSVERQDHYLLEAELPLFLRLSPHQKHIALEQAWERIKALKFNEYQQYKEILVSILIPLAEHWNEGERSQILREALTIAQQIEERRPWANAVISLLPLLPEEEVRDILSKVRGKKSSDLLVRAHAMRRISSPLEREQLVAEVLNETLSMKQGTELTNILTAAIEASTQTQMQLIWQQVQSWIDPKEHIRILFVLATRIPVQGRQNILHEIEDMIPRLPSARLQAVAYGDLAHLLSGLNKERILQKAIHLIHLIRKTQDHKEYSVALLAVYQDLPPKDLEQFILDLWNTDRRYNDERNQAITLAALGSVAPSPHNKQFLSQAEDKARHLHPERTQMQTLANLLPYLAEPSQKQLAQELLERGQQAYHDDVRGLTFLLRGIIPFLPKDLLGKVLQLSSSLNTNKYKALILTFVACGFSQVDEGAIALDNALSLFPKLHEKEQVELIELLVSSGWESLLPDLWERADSLKEAKQRIRALIYVFEHLPYSLRHSYAEKLLGLYRTFQPGDLDEVFSMHILITLAPYVTSERLITDIYHRLEKMKTAGNRIRVLVDLLSVEDLPSKDPLFREVAALLPSIDGEGIADVVSKITVHLLPLIPCDQYEYWNKLLHALAKHPRPHFLEGLSTQSPLLLSLGGKDAMVPISQAVVRIGTWWK